MNVGHYYEITEDECKETCLQNADCKSVEYGVYVKTCYMNSVTSTERPDRFYSSNTDHYWEKMFQ